jgi:serine/threonine protein kinase
MNPIVARRYDTAADIWSFGITILELAQGHAPMARLAPLKVLVNTIKYPPPELPPDSSGKHFSKALREMASLCLNKDPTKRPTASKLLEHRFLKEAKKKEFIVSHLLEGTLTTHESFLNWFSPGIDWRGFRLCTAAFQCQRDTSTHSLAPPFGLVDCC